MKLLFIALFIFFAPRIVSLAQEEEELIQEAVKNTDHDSLDKHSNNVILIGGLGIANSYGHGYYSNAPTMTMGIEFQSYENRTIALQCLFHVWYDDINSNKPLDNYFIKLNNNNYTQVGLSFIFKVYILPMDWPVRISLHLGVCGGIKDYIGADFGFSCYVRLFEDLQLSIEQRYIYDLNLCPGGCSGNGTLPILTLLNVYYYL